MPMHSHTSIEVFIAYSPKDNSYLKQLKTALTPLKRTDDVKIWCDKDVMPGEIREDVIKKKFQEADIILLLLSPDSLDCDYFYDQQVKALERHHKGQCKVVPIIIRPCMWEQTELNALQPLPQDAKSIEEWISPDAAYNNIAAGIAKLVEEMKNKRHLDDALQHHTSSTEKLTTPPSLPLIVLQDIQTADYSHALRPEFTQLCLRKLAVERQAINLWGEKGQGKKRLLDDICRTQLPHSLLVCLRVWENYTTLLTELATQLHTQPADNLANTLLPAVEHHNKHIFLCIDGIDTLYDQKGIPHHGYERFFVELNGLKNAPYCHLICSTELPKGSSFQTVSSPLTFDPHKLPDLSYQQLLNALQNANPPLPPNLHPYLAEQCETDPYPYHLLTDILNNSFTLNTREHALHYIKQHRKQRK